MKARVKTTGEIVEISTFQDNDKFPTTYDENELEFLIPDDYWEKLKHQYTGMAMQGWLSNTRLHPYNPDEIAEYSYRFTTALINKLKEEEK